MLSQSTGDLLNDESRQLEEGDQEGAQRHRAQVPAEEVADRAADGRLEALSVAAEVPVGNRSGDDHLLTAEDELADPDEGNHQVPPHIVDPTEGVAAVVGDQRVRRQLRRLHQRTGGVGVLRLVGKKVIREVFFKKRDKNILTCKYRLSLEA